MSTFSQFSIHREQLTLSHNATSLKPENYCPCSKKKKKKKRKKERKKIKHEIGLL